MNLIAKISLRWRVTLLTGALLALCSLGITLFSIYNAGKTYVPAIDTYITVAAIPLKSAIATTPAPSVGWMELVPSESEMVLLQKDLIPAAQVTNAFNKSGFVFFGVFTTVGMIAVYFIMGRALKPVGRLSTEISEITAHNLSSTLSPVESKDEISQLTQSFNLMLERLRGAFAQQKRFTASAAHELKTPLATIKASIQVLNMDAEPSIAEYRENNRILEASVDCLSAMVDQLLFLAWEGEDGEIQEEISLKDMVEAIYEEVAPLYEEKEIQWEISGTEGVFLGNEALFYRAIYNLIENACKYNIAKGLVQIAIVEEPTAVQLSIRDSGVGIGAEDLPLIFEAFYRADPSRSSEVSGSGLGLSIAKSILERSGATLRVESELGDGTCFTVLMKK